MDTQPEVAVAPPVVDPGLSAGVRRARTVTLMLRALPVLFLVVMGWAHRWVEEDAFLNFRIVDQIRAGHGPVFNIGERVEVATSPLWLGVLTVARSVAPFVKIERTSVVLGLVLTALGVWWAQAGAARLWRTRPSTRTALVVPVGAVVYVALPPAWDWATSGLENGLSIAWLGALMFLLGSVGRRDRAAGHDPWTRPFRMASVGVVAGLGPLVRPDLAVVSAVVFVVLLGVLRPRGAMLAWFLGGFFTLPVLSELFRAGYYGTLVPNTALAKDAGGTHWSQGWNYLVDLVAPYWLWLPLLALVALGVLLMLGRPAPTVVLALALPVAGVLHGFFIVKSGGDYLHARLLLPSVFAVLAPLAAVPWSRRILAPLAVIGAWVVVAILVLRPSLHQAYVPLTEHNVVDGRALMESLTRDGQRPLLADSFIFDDGPLARRLQDEGARALVTPPRNVHPDVTPARTTLISLASGISGYLAGPDVIVQESNSLADPVGSRMPPNSNNSPGHRKRESRAWILAMRTVPGVTLGQDPADVDVARRALACGDLKDLLEATEAPMSAGRFWSNLTGSISRTRLEVPRGPEAAAEKFCGPGGRRK
jgi:arabinofuranosyltransferase